MSLSERDCNDEKKDRKRERVQNRVRESNRKKEREEYKAIGGKKEKSIKI